VDVDGGARDFYVRQLWDWKISADTETITKQGLVAYADACGWTLARAHARSGDRIAIASYLGAGEKFDKAIAAFAVAYADLNERDHEALVDAVADGRVTAVENV
jgi:predicted alpha/beta hydrolase